MSYRTNKALERISQSPGMPLEEVSKIFREEWGIDRVDISAVMGSASSLTPNAEYFVKIPSKLNYLILKTDGEGKLAAAKACEDGEFEIANRLFLASKKIANNDLPNSLMSTVEFVKDEPLIARERYSSIPFELEDHYMGLISDRDINSLFGQDKRSSKGRNHGEEY